MLVVLRALETLNMSQKPVNPYDKLLESGRELGRQVTNPRVTLMCKATQENMKSIYSRVSAADALGWDVRVRAINGELLMEYVERPRVPAKFIQ
jgi:hypothetical protein